MTDLGSKTTSVKVCALCRICQLMVLYTSLFCSCMEYAIDDPSLEILITRQSKPLVSSYSLFNHSHFTAALVLLLSSPTVFIVTVLRNLLTAMSPPWPYCKDFQLALSPLPSLLLMQQLTGNFIPLSPLLVSS